MVEFVALHRKYLQALAVYYSVSASGLTHLTLTDTCKLIDQLRVEVVSVLVSLNPVVTTMLEVVVTAMLEVYFLDSKRVKNSGIGKYY